MLSKRHGIAVLMIDPLKDQLFHIRTGRIGIIVRTVGIIDRNGIRITKEPAVVSHTQLVALVNVHCARRSLAASTDVATESNAKM